MITTLRPTDRQTIRRTVKWLDEYLDDCDDKMSQHACEARTLALQLAQLVNRNDEKAKTNQNGT